MKLTSLPNLIHFESNILLRITSWDIFSLCSSLNVIDHVSQPYSKAGIIVVLYIFIFKFLQRNQGKKCLDWIISCIFWTESTFYFLKNRIRFVDHEIRYLRIFSFSQELVLTMITHFHRNLWVTYNSDIIAM